MFFASGAGFLMSRDVAIVALLEPKFGIVPIDRYWIQTGVENMKKDVFHYRCESYMHARTVEFMRHVIKKLLYTIEELKWDILIL
jgi:hypothetical protein